MATWIIATIAIAFFAVLIGIVIGFILKGFVAQAQGTFDRVESLGETVYGHAEYIERLSEVLNELSKAQTIIREEIEEKIVAYVKPTCRRLTEAEIDSLRPEDREC